MILCDTRHFWAAAVATRTAGLAASVEGTRLPLDPALNFPSRVILSKSVLHLPDWNAIDDLPAHERHIRDVSGIRAGLMLPLLRDGTCIGLLALVRVQPGGFSDKEIALAQSFCDQAMIAIGNTRLFNETQQALERQTATANVLKAISRSTFDLPAVLDTLITTAVRLSRAWIGVIFRIDGHLARPAGLFGGGQALYEHLMAHPIDLRDPKALVSRAIALGHAVQVEDAADPDAAGRKDAQQAGGYRTLLAVPVLRDGEAIGVLTMARQEVQPFTEAEVELVASFADQAAIAMENVRLFNETREALEQQTASAEVLQVIGSSVSDTKAGVRAHPEQRAEDPQHQLRQYRIDRHGWPGAPECESGSAVSWRSAVSEGGGVSPSHLSAAGTRVAARLRSAHMQGLALPGCTE